MEYYWNMDEANLSLQKCVPCEGGISPLTRNEAEEYLAQLEGKSVRSAGGRWELDDDAKDIEGEFEFFQGENWNAKWQNGIRFIQQIAEMSQGEDHHPTSIKISALKEGGFVRVKFSTHSIGGLSRNDFIMAAKLNELFANIQI
jgi:4a-hydroxytetrahydrobiopterin dehydratase